MTDRKQDIMTATGAHRAWVGERISEGAAAPVRSAAIARDLPRNWGARPQVGAQPAASSNSRHAAITKGLSNFPNYKTWAEKAKTNWKKDKPE